MVHGEVNAACTRIANASSLLAATSAAGNRRASSAAIDGPLSAASACVSPSVSPMMSQGTRNVSTSIPLATLTTGTPRGSASAKRVKVARMNCVGIAHTTIVAVASTDGSAVTRTFSLSVKCASRGLLRVAASSVAACAKGERIATEPSMSARCLLDASPNRYASTSASTSAICPSPTITMCSECCCVADACTNGAYPVTQVRCAFDARSPIAIVSSATTLMRTTLHHETSAAPSEPHRLASPPMTTCSVTARLQVSPPFSIGNFGDSTGLSVPTETRTAHPCDRPQHGHPHETPG